MSIYIMFTVRCVRIGIYDSTAGCRKQIQVNSPKTIDTQIYGFKFRNQINYTIVFVGAAKKKKKHNNDNKYLNFF